MRVVQLPGGARLCLLTADEVYSLQQAEAYMPTVEEASGYQSAELAQIAKLADLICDVYEEQQRLKATLERLIQILGS